MYFKLTEGDVCRCYLAMPRAHLRRKQDQKRNSWIKLSWGIDIFRDSLNRDWQPWSKRQRTLNTWNRNYVVVSTQIIHLGSGHSGSHNHSL